MKPLWVRKNNSVRDGTPEKPIGSMNQLLKIRPDWSFIIDRVERNVRHKRAPLSKKNATVAKRSVIRLKILQSATKVDTIFYLSEKVIRSALRIRR